MAAGELAVDEASKLLAELGDQARQLVLKVSEKWPERLRPAADAGHPVHGQWDACSTSATRSSFIKAQRKQAETQRAVASLVADPCELPAATSAAKASSPGRRREHAPNDHAAGEVKAQPGHNHSPCGDQPRAIDDRVGRGRNRQRRAEAGREGHAHQRRHQLVDLGLGADGSDHRDQRRGRGGVAGELARARCRRRWPAAVIAQTSSVPSQSKASGPSRRPARSNHQIAERQARAEQAAASPSRPGPGRRRPARTAALANRPAAETTSPAPSAPRSPRESARSATGWLRLGRTTSSTRGAIHSVTTVRNTASVLRSPAVQRASSHAASADARAAPANRAGSPEQAAAARQTAPRPKPRSSAHPPGSQRPKSIGRPKNSGWRK